MTTTANGKGSGELVTRAASREVGGGARRQAFGSTRRGDVFIEARREKLASGIGIEGVSH